MGFQDIWDILTGDADKKRRLLEQQGQSALKELDTKTQTALTNERQKTDKQIADLEADISVLHTQMLFLSKLLLFEGTPTPPGEIRDIFAIAKTKGPKAQEGIRSYSVMYITKSKDRARNALELATAFEHRQNSIDPLLAAYKDLKKRETELTLTLQALRESDTRTITTHLEKIPDSQEKIALRAKYTRAISPLIAMVTENTALITDIKTTIAPAVEAVETLKKTNSSLDSYKRAATTLLARADPDRLREIRELDQIENLLVEVAGLNQRLSELQEKLATWRDTLVPAITQATTHLERDRLLIIEIRTAYRQMQNDLIDVISEIKKQLYPGGREKFTVRVISRDFDELIEEAEELDKQFEIVHKLIKMKQDDTADTRLRKATSTQIPIFFRGLEEMKKKLTMIVVKAIENHGVDEERQSVINEFVEELEKSLPGTDRRLLDIIGFKHFSINEFHRSHLKLWNRDPNAFTSFTSDLVNGEMYFNRTKNWLKNKKEEIVKTVGLI